MSKYIPTAEIPERGNIMFTPFETITSMRGLSDADRLEFVTAQLDWMLKGETETLSNYILQILFERWVSSQLKFADKAIKRQSSSKNALRKRWNKIPPPTR